jgi:hypothetical protein
MIHKIISCIMNGLDGMVVWIDETPRFQVASGDGIAGKGGNRW